MNPLVLADAVQSLVPPREVLGLPGAVGLFQALMVVGFALHAVFMNFTMGAAVVVPGLWLFGMRRKRDDWIDVARTCVRVWPIAVSLTITTGILPLLIVQVLYGHIFYTANIVLGWRWLSILAALLIGFYGVYVLDGVMRHGRLGPGLGLMLLIAAAFLWVGHEFNNNSVLMLLPEQWKAIHDGAARSTARHAMWLPRLLHSNVGAVALTGLWIAAIGRSSRTLAPESRRMTIEVGLRIALVATALQVLIGLWFYVALDATTQAAVLNLTTLRGWLWVLAVVAGMGMLFALFQGVQSPDDPRSVWRPIGLAGFVLLGMAAGRESIRIEMLSRIPGALYTAADVRPQTGPLVIFLVVAACGAAVIFVLLKWANTAVASTPRGHD